MLLAAAETEQQAPLIADELARGLVIAAFGAALGLLANYLLAHWKQRKEPLRRISYETQARQELGITSTPLRDRVQILYRGQPADRIHSSECRLRNSGNQKLQDVQIRFEFDEGTTILDPIVNPLPPREVGLVHDPSDELEDNEVRYFIASLKPQEEIHFQFVVANATGSLLPRVNEQNPGEYIEIVSTGELEQRDDLYHLQRFVWIAVLLWVLPGLFRFTGVFFVDQITTLLTGLVALGLVVALFRHIGPVARIAGQALTALGDRSVAGRHQEITVTDGVVIVDSPYATAPGADQPSPR
jgi:hypothetical protein